MILRWTPCWRVPYLRRRYTYRFASLAVTTWASLWIRSPYCRGWVNSVQGRDAWPPCWPEASPDRKQPGTQWGECWYCIGKASGPGPAWSSAEAPAQTRLWTRWSDGHCSSFAQRQEAAWFYSCTLGWPNCSHSPGCLLSRCTSEWCFPWWKWACRSSEPWWSSQVQRCPARWSERSCAQKEVPFSSQRGPARFPFMSRFIETHLKENMQFCYHSLSLEMSSFWEKRNPWNNTL